jgi:hypothetical protein
MANSPISSSVLFQNSSSSSQKNSSPTHTFFSDLQNAGIPTYTFVPREFTTTAYNELLSVGAEATGYRTVAEGLATLNRKIKRTEDPALFYFYTPHIDSLAHAHGPFSFQSLAEADAPLLLHTNEPVGHKYPGKAPMTLAALYGLVRRHPETKLVLAHMAGGLFFYSLLKKEVSQALRNVWIDTAAAPFLYQPRAYGLAVELLGADKVLLGSDYPLLPVSRYQREMQDPRAGLGDGALEMVMGRAALELIP